MNQTVVGTFPSYPAAQAAADKLAAQGFSRDEMDIKSIEAGTAASGTTRPEDRDADRGMMASIGDFFSGLFGADDDRQYAGHYSEAVRRGHAVLTVGVDAARVDAAHEALSDAGAVDIDERVANWRSQGYTEHERNAAPFDAEQVRGERESVIPVVQEELEVGKRQVRGGAVRVVSRVESKPVHESVELRREEAVVERRPVDREASEKDLASLQERTIEVEETAEKAVVNKTARVVEEVVVGKKVSHETKTIDDEVRRTDVHVERDGETSSAEAVQQASGRRGFADHDSDFRRDYDSNYAALGGSYDDYEPAYRGGFEMRHDERYRDRDWNAVEPDARRDWERRSPGTWERVKAAFQRGWEHPDR